MENSRRNFLKIAGISALGMGAGPVFDVFAGDHGHEAEEAEHEESTEAAHEEVAEEAHGEEEHAEEAHAEAEEAHGGEAAHAEESHETGTAKTMKGEDALTAKRWGMVIDTRQFESEEDFEPLIEACHSIHNVPDFTNENMRHEIKWIWLEEFHNAFPTQAHALLNHRIHSLPFLTLCNHCDKPACVRACPTKATFKRDDGIVIMDFHRCIGCRFCMAACPYGSRSFNFRDPRPFIPEIHKEYPTRMKGVVEKCNFCAERLAVGKIPACVEAAEGKIAFGDLDDPHSEVREWLEENFVIRRKPNLGAGPNIYYIV